MVARRNTKKRNTKKRNTKKRVQRGGEKNLLAQVYNNSKNDNNSTNENYWREKVKQIMRKRPGSTINVAPTRFNEISEYDMKRKHIKTYEEYYHTLIKEYEEADRNSEYLRGLGGTGPRGPHHP
jgi:hypothetical protein